MLAVPTFALALAITLVSTYLSAVTRRYTQQTTIIGVIIASEGVMALWVPLFVGAWSDKLRTRIGGRLPFVIAGAVPAAAALTLIGFVGSLGLVGVVAAIFFGFYFVAYEPYRAMYPDLLDEDRVAGRAQSTQAVARGVGTALALLGGGLLLSVARPLPFVVAAVILLLAIGVFVALAVRRASRDRRHRNARKQSDSPLQLIARLPLLLKKHRALRRYILIGDPPDWLREPMPVVEQEV
jgi:Na+/melibiose symporter-like transporter